MAKTEFWAISSWVIFATLTTLGTASETTRNPCWTVRCHKNTPKCIVLDNGSAKCIVDPCVDLICNAASTCEIDESGQAFCLPLPGNPGNPVDPCADLICNAASTCEIDESGQAFCLPLPGNPGNPIDDATCASVTCPTDAPICTILSDGTPACSKKGVHTINHNGSNNNRPPARPEWWGRIKKNFVGKGLSRCKRFKNVAPLTGTRCKGKNNDKKKKGKQRQMTEKTCFFGNQECEGVGSFPDTKCVCTKDRWKCDDSLECPVSP